MKTHRALTRRQLLEASAQAAAAASVAGFMPGAFAASAWPDKPIRIVVSSAPGGIDAIVRLIMPTMQERLGQPVIIDNKAGANGIIGVQAVTSSPADGYTILFTTISTLTINPFVYAKLPYDTLKDLEPVALHATLPMVWVSPASTPFKSLDDIIAYARSKPGALNVGNPGNGSFGHLLEESLRNRHNIDVTLVPFKTTPQAMTETIAGRVDLYVDNVSNLLQFINQDKLTALAVTSRERCVALPSVPGWLEKGHGEFEAVAWYAFMAPKGTPPEIIQRLNAEVNFAIETPAAQKYLQSTGAGFTPRTPAQVREFIQGELGKYGAIAKQANIALQ